MAKKQSIKFQRIGGLSLTKQKGYDSSMPGFHSPPVAKGIYAFPWPYFEWFLLSAPSYSGAKTKHAKFEYIRDKEGNKIHWEPWQASIKAAHTAKPMSKKAYESKLYTWTDDGGFVIKPKKIRIFKYKGPIWHHLGYLAKPGEILDTKGSWYLSEMDVYEKLLKKEEHAMIKQSAKTLKEWTKEITFPVRLFISLDHIEVFISNKI